MKSEDFVSKFDLDGLLEYVNSLEVTLGTGFLILKIRHYSDNYRFALLERDKVKEDFNLCRMKYWCSKWYNRWFFSILKNKYFNLLVRVNGVLKLYEETILDAVKDLECLLEMQNKK